MWPRKLAERRKYATENKGFPSLPRQQRASASQGLLVTEERQKEQCFICRLCQIYEGHHLQRVCEESTTRSPFCSYRVHTTSWCLSLKETQEDQGRLRL